MQPLKKKGRVAQLNRVADYGSAGYRFESCRDHFYFNNDGSLAQLNRASDYGSEGYRFESYGSHKKPTQEGRFRCLLVCEVAVGRFFQSSASLHPPFRLCRVSRFFVGIIFYLREVLLTSHYEKRLFEHASQPCVAGTDIRLLPHLRSRTNLSRDSYPFG